MEQMLKELEERLTQIVVDAVDTALSNYEVATSSEVSDTFDKIDYLKTDFTDFLDKWLKFLDKFEPNECLKWVGGAKLGRLNQKLRSNFQVMIVVFPLKKFHFHTVI